MDDEQKVVSDDDDDEYDGRTIQTAEGLAVLLADGSMEDALAADDAAEARWHEEQDLDHRLKVARVAKAEAEAEAARLRLARLQREIDEDLPLP